MCWRISTMCLYPHANAAGLVRWWHHWVWGLRTWGVDVWCSPLGFLTWGQGAPQVPKARPWCCSTRLGSSHIHGTPFGHLQGTGK